MPFWIEDRPFEWRDSTMYMIVVDRFANGERAADAPVGVEYPADFHGGDLDGIADVIRSGYFDDMGVNVLWLSPINAQASGSFAGRDDGHMYAGYHGYWPRRGREVEPRFGADAALREVVDEAHRRGIRVLLDLINNQVHSQHEYFTAHPEWFRTGCVCGIDPGCGWSERPLDCLFASYLPDIDWRVPEAEAQFVGDALHWIEAYGVDGFRIDAVKHVETNSIYDVRAATAARYERAGYRHYFVGETAVGQWDAADYGCGESFADGYAWLDAYVGPNALDGQFDFPSHHRLAGLVDGTMGFDAVESVVADAQLRLRPEGLHVRFLGTHDSSRMASRAAMDSRSGCRWMEGGCTSLPGVPSDPAVYARLRRAIAVLFTMPGVPFLYYGDEIALAGGNDPDNRRDMPWDAALAPLSMSSDTISAQQLALRDFVRAVGRARADGTALRRGRRIPLVVEADTYAVAWAGDAPGELAVMVATRGGALSGRAIDGLGAGQLAGVSGFDTAAGSGTLVLAAGNRLRATVPAGEAAIFLAR
jgi:glycosidase